MDLNQKLTGLREKEVEHRSRAADLAEAAATRDLNSDELSELGEIETSLGGLQDQQRGIERSLSIGRFHKDANDEVGLNAEEIRNFSILKLIKANSRDATDADKEAAKMEMEASRSVESKNHVAARGCWLPNEIVRGEKRDLTADAFSQAGALVGVDFRPQSMIELLRTNMALTGLGATVLSGLVGDVSIPKQTGAGNVAWLGSDGDTLGETNQAVGQVSLTPRTLGAYTDFSRQLRLQSSMSVEQFVRNDLMAITARAVDVSAFHGTGTSGQPLGIQNVTGIGAQSFSTGSTPTRSEVIGMRSDLANAEALNGNLGFVTGSTVYANMLDTVIDAGSGQFLVQQDGGALIGRKLVESNQITAGAMIFGNWSDLLIGEWAGMDIMIDPYTGATAGTTRVLIFQTVDVAVRHAQSFCYGA